MKQLFIAVLAFFFVTSTAYAVSTQLDFSNGVVKFFKPMFNASLQVPSITATSTTATSTFPIAEIENLFIGNGNAFLDLFANSSGAEVETTNGSRIRFNDKLRFDSDVNGINQFNINNMPLVFRTAVDDDSAGSKGGFIEWDQLFASTSVYQYGETTKAYNDWNKNGQVGPAPTFSPVTTGQKRVGWFGCHYNSPATTGEAIHQHCNWETAQGDLSTVVTRIGVSYGEDTALVSFPNSEVMVFDNKPLYLSHTGFARLIYNSSNDEIQFLGAPVKITSTSTLASTTVSTLNVLTNTLAGGNLSVGTTAAAARVTIQGTGASDLLDVDNSGGSSVFTLLASGAARLLGITEPTAPSAGNLLTYAKSVAGKLFFFQKNQAGESMPTQDALWNQNTVMWKPTTVTDGLWIGTAGAGAGTFANTNPSNSTLYTQMKRALYSNVITTTNQVLGQRNTEEMWWRGDSAGEGGYHVCANYGFTTWTNGSRAFFGLHSGTTVVSAEPSALNNTVGFAVDSGDNGAISFLTRDTTAATKAPTGLTITSGKGYKACFYAAPNSSSISWWIKDINTGTEASGTATNNLPTNTTFLTVGVLASNGALTPANSTQLGVNQITVQSDY